MLKFIWGKGTQPNAERHKHTKELFAFQKTIHHGFPHKPNCLSWDPRLKLLALGLKSGGLRVYGAPGVEFYGSHSSERSVLKVSFLHGEGKLLTLTDDNELHCWEIVNVHLECKKSLRLEGRLKRISCLEIEQTSDFISFLGTEGGNIYSLTSGSTLELSDKILHQDVVSSQVSDYKVNPGPVESLKLSPKDSENLLIGYARGLIVLWNLRHESVLQSFVSSQQLESLSWRGNGSQFLSSHNDGSLNVWSTGNGVSDEKSSMPYGPYPCKAISKTHWAHSEGVEWRIFTGGMPRASYGDKYTLSVMNLSSEKHVVFDLTSKIIDFSVISENELPAHLVVLAEEELLLIDLTSPDWPVHWSPYLNSIHASSVTTMNIVSNVQETLYNELLEIKSEYFWGKTSKAPWPISGGFFEPPSYVIRDILLTGHEDGSVKLWSCGSTNLIPLHFIKTSRLFLGDEMDGERRDEDDENENEDDDEEWPPFRKVGTFDPYSDDPRLAVKKVSMCPKSGKVFIGGTAGQVLIYDLEKNKENDKKPRVSNSLSILKSDLVTEKEGFTWKGHSALTVSSLENNNVNNKGHLSFSLLLQITPPASINSLGFDFSHGVLAAGTAHGLVLLNVSHKSLIASKCTLNASDIANADDNHMSRRKSLKKSLRESFRKLRKGRSQRQMDKKKSVSSTTDPIKKELRSDSPESRPVERSVEARSGSEDGLGSMVRCIHFANTYIANPSNLTATLWAGTNSGQILIFMLTSLKDGSTSSVLAKEIQLKHRAPVIDIQVLDSHGLPVSMTSSDSTPHRVLITSEEQFKIFLLPTLKPCGKYKLTAHEGSRIRRVGFTSFLSKSDESLRENCFVCLTNLGDIAVHSLPELRRQIQTQSIKKEDVIAISSLVFTSRGEAFYLSSSSEIQRVSMAAAQVLRSSGTLHIPSRIPSAPENSAPTPSLPNDPHNETTVSEMSADITLDSVKDHTIISQFVEINESPTTVLTTTTIINDKIIVTSSSSLSKEEKSSSGSFPLQLNGSNHSPNGE